jgi:small subunit ribosomal protein S20
MAHSRTARKRIRQNAQRRAHNRVDRSRLRTELKKLETLIKTGDTPKADAQLRVVAKLLDKAGQAGIIHPNKAARHKSRFATAIAAAARKSASAAHPAGPPQPAAGG